MWEIKKVSLSLLLSLTAWGAPALHHTHSSTRRFLATAYQLKHTSSAFVVDPGLVLYRCASLPSIFGKTAVPLSSDPQPRLL